MHFEPSANRPSQTVSRRPLPVAPFVAVFAGGVTLNALTRLDARVYAVPIALLGALTLVVVAIAVWKCARALAEAFAVPHPLLTVITGGEMQGTSLSTSPGGAHTVRRWIKTVKPARRPRAQSAVRR